jgi:hypothetical protein
MAHIPHVWLVYDDPVLVQCATAATGFLLPVVVEIGPRFQIRRHRVISDRGALAA